MSIVSKVKNFGPFPKRQNMEDNGKQESIDKLTLEYSVHADRIDLVQQPHPNSDDGYCSG